MMWAGPSARSEKGVRMLYDTDVLVWFFRGNAKAVSEIQKDRDRKISVVSYMELLQGARNKTELKQIKKFLHDYAFEMVPLTENMGLRAAIYMEEYVLSSKLYMGDALIAAAAVEEQLTLCSGNANPDIS